MQPFDNLIRILQNLQTTQTAFTSPFVDIARDTPLLTDPSPSAPAAAPFSIVLPSLAVPTPSKPSYVATSTLRLFPDDTVPAADDPAGYQVLSLVRDLMANFHANRHEGAKVLLDLTCGLWLTGGGKLFRSREPADELGRELPGTWVLDHILLEVRYLSICKLVI